MGMYDIIDNVKVYCPGCGEIITDSFHTKDIKHPSLNHYQPGDTIPENREFEDCLEIHTIHEACGLFTNVALRIDENNKLTADLC